MTGVQRFQHKQRFTKGFRNAVSSQCFALNSDEKYWVYNGVVMEMEHVISTSLSHSQTHAD